MRRLAVATARTIATIAVFVAATGTGAAAHLGAPTVRRAIVRRVDEALASTFQGRVIVERVGALGASGADGLDVTVKDPDGQRSSSSRGPAPASRRSTRSSPSPAVERSSSMCRSSPRRART